MSPLRLRASSLLLLLLLLLLLGSCLLAAARRDPGAAGSAAASARGPGGGSPGRFLGPERQACSRQLARSAPGLRLRCRGAGGERRRCARRGEPPPRRDPAPPRARLCAAPRLVPRAPPPAGPTAARLPPQEPKPRRAGSRGRPREPPAIGPAAAAAAVPPPRGARPKGKPSEERKTRKTKGGKRKAAPGPGEERRPLGTGPDAHGLDPNAKFAGTYCAEEWRSLCNFLVGVWNG